MGNWFAGWRQHEPQHPTGEDYATFMKDLEEIETYLKTVNRRLSRAADDGDSRRPLDDLSDDFIQVVKLKQQQLTNIRKHIQSVAQTSQPAPQSLSDLVDAVEKLCQETISRISRRSRADQVQAPPVMPVAAAAAEIELEPVIARDPPVRADLEAAPLIAAAPESDDGDEDPGQESGSSPGRGIDGWIEEMRQRSPNPDLYTTWEVDRHCRDVLEIIADRYLHTNDRELNRDFQVRFTGEQGIDRGALTREFFHLAFEKVLSDKFKDCALMTGERGHLLPDHATDHLVYGYKFVGMLIAHAVRNECRGLPGLSPAIQHYLVHGCGKGRGIAFIEELCPPVCTDDVADEKLRTLLCKVSHFTFSARH
jgi:hypothetical protein